MRRFHADLLLFACAAIWGFAFLFQKSAMQHVGPLTFVSARSFVACLALAPLAIYELRRQPRPSHGLITTAIIAGIAFFLAAILQQTGLVTASVTNTGFLTALYVVATPFIAWALLGQQPAPLVWIAAAISFVGTWLLGGGTLDAFHRGDVLVGLSAGFWALHVVLVGRATRFDLPLTFTALQFLIVALLGALGALAFEPTNAEAIRRAAVDIAYVGLLSSALTFTLFAFALRHTRPAEAAIIVSTETVFAALGAYLMLGERLPPIGWLGAAAIGAAILTVQFADSRKASSKPVETPEKR